MSNTNYQNLIYIDNNRMSMMKNNDIGKKIAAAFFVMTLAVTAVLIIPIDDSSADDTITVTDGRGTTVTFSDVAAHVVTCGKGPTATVIQLGQLDKIVVCDSYSKNGTEDVFKDLKTRIADGKIKADGNVYSSGLAAFKTNVIAAADTEKGGTFDKEKDVIILTASAANNTSLNTYFSEAGFKKILIWDSITEYGQIIDFATAVSKVLTGSVSDSVKSMELVKKTISDRLTEKSIADADKTKSIYVRVSSSNLALGNTGSLTTSMIDAAGGKNLGKDAGKASPTYTISASELTTMRSANGTDKIVVFLDTTVTDEKLTEIQGAMGTENTTYVKLDGLWNNYSIDSKNGVWTMACALYPDYFEGDVPEVKSGGNDNIVLYAAVGGAAAVIILVAAFVLMRRH